MRLDKFLKVALIFKTRNSALKAIKDGKVTLNNSRAKPSTEVKINDNLAITFPLKKVEYKILMIKEKNVSKQEAKELYEISKEEKIEI